ncbi:hypothetical protein GGF38_000280 [Coemansia sp. RSA 25]|nr:hypothetical protein GGF38_000280 [Coemansia sp. RSA 25]
MCISESSQAALRSAIKALLANTALTESDRAKRIQALMSGRSCASASMAEGDSTPVAFCVSYNNEEQRILGCSHYQLKAKLLAPCCNQWVPCRFCHDEDRQHAMDRFAVSRMKRRDELLTSKLWINELKSQYIRSIVGCAKELPTDLERFPSSIHAYVDYYSNTYALNREALVAYRAQAIFIERMKGAAFIPNNGELKKLEMSVVEEERLLEQVQLRLSEKVQAANEKIDSETRRYEETLGLVHENDVLAREVAELEAELEALSRALEEKEAKERDAVEQQTRELQAAHNDLLREAAMREEIDREQARLEDRLLRLKSDEQKRRMSAADSQEQQKLVERWIRSVAPVVNARVENSTLVLTLGEGLGAMSGRRILVGFSSMGKVTSVETDDGRRFPPVLNHDTLMKLLSE